MSGPQQFLRHNRTFLRLVQQVRRAHLMWYGFICSDQENVRNKKDWQKNNVNFRTEMLSEKNELNK